MGSVDAYVEKINGIKFLIYFVITSNTLYLGFIIKSGNGADSWPCYAESEGKDFDFTIYWYQIRFKFSGMSKVDACVTWCL